jgi:hypothetical protein
VFIYSHGTLIMGYSPHVMVLQVRDIAVLSSIGMIANGQAEVSVMWKFLIITPRS